MGYTTDFTGRFDLDRPLSPEHAAYLDKFSDTRRMQRDAKRTERRDDPVRAAVGLPVGVEGGYFIGAVGFAGQEEVGLFKRVPEANDIIEYNNPPKGQPGLWCQWVPTEDGRGIEWNGAEKFYAYVEWLRYLVEHFLTPWGYRLSGTVEWQGEESSDFGRIVVKDSVVTTAKGRRSFGKAR